MDTKSITAVIIGLMVSGLILVAFVPVFAEVTDPMDTVDNTQYGYYDMKPIETDDIWVYSNGSWTYNGEPVAINTDGDRVSVIVTDNTTIRQDSMIRSTIYSGSNAETVEAVVVTDTDYIAITNVAESTTNVIYTSGYGVASDGDYILKKYTTAGYVKGDTPLWVTGFTNLVEGEGNSQVIVHIEGTIDDGLTITVTPKKYGTATDLTVGEYTLNYEVATQGVDLYKVTSVTFNVTGTYGGEEVTTPFTYSTFVIPKEVTYEKSVHGDEVFNTLIDFIPLLAGVGLLMAGVYYFISRK